MRSLPPRPPPGHTASTRQAFFSLPWPGPSSQSPDLSPGRLPHSAAPEESWGLGSHIPAGPSVPSSAPLAAAAAARGPPAAGRRLVPVLAEEETEDTLPWGAGEPAGCAEWVERVQGATGGGGFHGGHGTLPLPSLGCSALLEDPGLGVGVGAMGVGDVRTGAGKQWVSSGCKTTPLGPWRGTDWDRQTGGQGGGRVSVRKRGRSEQGPGQDHEVERRGQAESGVRRVRAGG